MRLLFFCVALFFFSACTTYLSFNVKTVIIHNKQKKNTAAQDTTKTQEPENPKK